MSKVRPNQDRELAQLREHIEEITKSIIDLVGARQKLSQEVARIKRKQDLPIENLDVEARLAEDIVKYAKRLDVDEPLVRAILSEILSSSKIVQRRLYYSESIKYFLKENGIRTVSIIGAGRMGGWFAAYFLGLVPRLILYDANQEKARNLSRKLGVSRSSDLIQVADESDLAVVAVPISRTVPMIRRLVSLSKGRKLRIIEVTSVKTPIIESGVLNPKQGVEIVSIHPIFGPDARHFGSNLIVQASSKKDLPSSEFIERLFPHYKILKMQAEDHDRVMSYLLTLPHTLALIFAKVILKNPELYGKGKGNLSGPSFDRIMQLTTRVLSENPNVYFEIQSMNRSNKMIDSQLEEAFLELKKSRNDRRLFTKLFSEAREKVAAITPIQQ
ncbi:MAG: prephenate dehydrogenase/arogenate dehydrogenase family protein [Nitrososphaerales archaeon]